MTYCLLDDAGVFLGFTSQQHGLIRRFFDERIVDIFAKYKEKRMMDSEEDSAAFREFREHFYKPQGYYLFGDHDLAILSIVDSFEFGVKEFAPANPSKGGGASLSHHAVLGPTPKFKEKESILDNASETFLAQKAFPLISITQIKVSNALIDSHGTDFLRSVVTIVRLLARQAAREHCDKSGRLSYLVLESFSWHEITLILFSDSYRPIFKLVPKLREITASQIHKEIYSSDKSNFAQLSPLLKSVCRNHSEKFDTLDFPAILSTSTYLGFDLRIYTELEADADGGNLYQSIAKEDYVWPVTRWTTRGGHLKTLASHLLEDFGPAHICFGREDILSSANDLSQKTRSADYIKRVVDTEIDRLLRRHTVSVCTVHTDKEGVNGLEDCTLTAKDYKFLDTYSDRIKSLAFKHEVIEEMDRQLEVLRVPLILRNAILKIFSGFNQGVSDPLLYSSFLELRPVLQRLASTVNHYEGVLGNFQKNLIGEDQARTELNELPELLVNIVHSFASAASNRLQSSHLSGHIADFTLFFRGGIQQLVTTYDGLYKIVSAIMNNQESFAFIEGDPTISTYEWGLRMNYLHVFKPEILATTIIHEGANNLLDQFVEVKDVTLLDTIRSLTSHHSKSVDILDEVTARYEDKYVPFLKHINPRFFENVLSDCFALNFGYLKELDLFSYWCWREFDRWPLNCTLPDRVPVDSYVDFLLRQLMVVRLCASEKDFAEYKVPGDRRIASREGRLINAAKKFVASLASEFEVEAWNESLQTFIGLRASKILEMDVLKFREESKPDIATITKSIENGLCIQFGVGDSPKRAFVNTQLLLFSYLNLLYTKIGTAENYALDDWKPKDYGFRRDYFKYRSVVTMSLWDMAVRQKGQYIIRCLES